MEPEQIKKDAIIMALRLLGEDENKMSPECREVMKRWRPIVMEAFELGDIDGIHITL